MIPKAISRLVVQRSMACFSMWRWASASVIFSCSMSSHFARFTRRISSIFSSTEVAFSSMRRNRSRAETSHFRLWFSSRADVGFASALADKLAAADGARYGAAAEKLAQKAAKAAQRRKEQQAHEKNRRKKG